mgnify:CR=1 FL=1
MGGDRGQSKLLVGFLVIIVVLSVVAIVAFGGLVALVAFASDGGSNAGGGTVVATPTAVGTGTTLPATELPSTPTVGATSEVPTSTVAAVGGSPTLTPTRTITSSPMATDTPSPTRTLTPSPTATVTPSPTRTPTPSPTATATPSPTATPPPTPAPDGESYSFDGSGGDVTDTFETTGGLVTFDLEHTGDSNFAVWLVSDDGDQEELLANIVGEYDGTYAMYLQAGEYQLDIDADGDWTADIEQPRYSAAELESLPADASGEDSDYMGPYQFEDATEITIEAENDAAVSVWLARHDGQLVDLLANDIGPYEETTLITDSGTGLIFIQTDGGEWQIEIGDE